MTATANRKKVRYHNRDTNQLVWALPDDLPDYEKERLAALAQGSLVLDGPEKVNDYGPDIEQWRDELRTAVDDIRAARDSNQSFKARNRAEQYKMAMDIYRAAEYIPASTVQFGSYRADFHFRCPPRLEEYGDIAPLRHGTQHRYITSDPVEIAYLRTIKDFEEVPVGHVYSRPEGKKDGLWVPLDMYLMQKAIGQAV